MNYIQLNDKGNFDEEELACKNYFDYLGQQYISFYKKHFIRDNFQITKDDFIVGDIDVMFHAMKRLGIEYYYNDYPKYLHPYLCRNIWESTLGDIRKQIYNKSYLDKPIFIKPKDNLKRFTGFILETVDDLINCHNSGNQTKIWCSDVVHFVEEYRCYIQKETEIIDNKKYLECKAITNYKGNFEYKNKVKDALYNILLTISKEYNIPNAFVLDLGILNNGQIALVEMNDMFSIGKYQGISDKDYAKMLIDRWNELKGK